MELGVDVLLKSASLRAELKGRKIAVLGHPASVTSEVTHSLDALIKCPELNITSAFGPQHGMKGDKQYNMIETPTESHGQHALNVFSLYGEVRRPTAEMMATFDVVLVDLQDVGTRIYTYVATLLYMMEEAAKTGKSVWVLDRPNPAGRPIEGTFLRKGWESYVGATYLPMRHGLTMGEIARYLKDTHKLKLDLRVIEMKGYDPDLAPGFGWPSELTWVNPSPNIPTLPCARAYPGTVLIEGTNLSEARGTTHPLEMVGAPGLRIEEHLAWMSKTAPRWLEGCRLRPCYFAPTFYKFKDELCSGFQIHADGSNYRHDDFRPLRLTLLFLKSLRQNQSDSLVWRKPGYEYDFERFPVDLLAGSSLFREWVDDPAATTADLDALFVADERPWAKERKAWLLY